MRYAAICFRSLCQILIANDFQAARSFGCEVDTLTLSKEQKALADERIKAAGLEDRIRVHLMDYRDLPPKFEKAFDAFVSIEMVEVSRLQLVFLYYGN